MSSSLCRECGSPTRPSVLDRTGGICQVCAGEVPGQPRTPFPSLDQLSLRDPPGGQEEEPTKNALVDFNKTSPGLAKSFESLPEKRPMGGRQKAGGFLLVVGYGVYLVAAVLVCGTLFNSCVSIVQGDIVSFIFYVGLAVVIGFVGQFVGGILMSSGVTVAGDD